MKTKHFKLLGCAALSIMCAMVSHAQSVSSTPVGYVTQTINAGTGVLKLSNSMEQCQFLFCNSQWFCITSFLNDAGATVGDLTTDGSLCTSSASGTLRITSGIK